MTKLFIIEETQGNDDWRKVLSLCPACLVDYLGWAKEGPVDEDFGETHGVADPDHYAPDPECWSCGEDEGTDEPEEYPDDLDGEEPDDFHDAGYRLEVQPLESPC